jgi:metal-responsive CopG/Arc/MetJ family transcriptional regulator
MKVKTSITLERDVISAIDQQIDEYGSRSEFLETAARRLLARLAKEEKDRRDMDIINRRVVTLNREAEDVLDYQVAL